MNQKPRKLLVVSTHSFVDLITNSSTELFVCDSKKTLDATKELLATLLKHHDEVSGESHSFDSVYGTIAVAKFNFDWYKVSAPVQDAYKYYHRYCSLGQNKYSLVSYSSDRNPEEEELEEDVRHLAIKFQIYEDGLYEKDKEEYNHRYAEYRKASDALWTEYGSRALKSEKDLFIEFLKQNDFSPENIDLASLTFDDEIERHIREKRGQHSWKQRQFTSPELNEAYEAYSECSSWGITMKKGDIFVYSASDNTIPYLLFDTIASYLNADRYHLG